MSSSDASRWALLSVSDKRGLAALAAALVTHGFRLLSTGGTAQALRELGHTVSEVAELTGFPEIMDGRVKTLHPKVHGGLLGRPGLDEATMRAHGIPAIDVLVLNLYPFEAVTSDPNCDFATAIEHIDIGGPAMLRAAAKNHARVAVVCDPDQYQDFIAALERGHGVVEAALRRRLAIEAFARITRYDAAISDWLQRHGGAEVERLPALLHLDFERSQTLRYGENPHQQAALYRPLGQPARGLAGAVQRAGKALSFNNFADADAAWGCVCQFETPACVIVKHANPCGVALAEDPATAYVRAWQTDPTSAFGGVIAFNRRVDGALVAAILERQFVELLLAPAFTEAALAEAARKPNVRLLEIASAARAELDLRCISGGLLVQQADQAQITATELRQVSARAAQPDELADLLFAWRVARYVKSNAIVYARGLRTLGIGAGQMSRVDSARLGLLKANEAGLSVHGAVMASDAFFPFRDGVDTAAAAGVRAIIQPGGSMRDAEVIAAADEAGLAMLFTGLRHFRH